ncbi:MAG: GGDEF domain-containing protein [Methanosarcina sp.]
MVDLKPIALHIKFGIKQGLGYLITILIGVTVASFKLNDIVNFFVPNSTFLNWHFVSFLIIFPAFIVFLIMYYLWINESNKHEIAKKEINNLEEALRNSEVRRLTDVITGVPNSEALKKDIDNYFSKSSNEMQCILIDLCNFKKINEKFGIIKTNDLLRTIAQTIYKRMRRNEQMYKFLDKGSNSSLYTKIYRVFPGGDEFVFIIFGDQSDALGFSNRLVGIFNEITDKTPQILGVNTQISFSCAIVKMDCNDSYNDLLNNVRPCYQTAKEGKSEFTIYWHPDNIEKILSADEKKRNDYKRARELFKVMTPSAKDYGL